jgi:Ala-tRNA(Pro) deacylase
MGIAKQLEWFLEQSGVEYEVLPHPHSSYSAQTARRSRIPLHLLAKPVLLEDEYGYVMAVVPAARQVDIERLGAQLHRRLELATEAEVGDLFRDCEPGAMPALGTPYQIPTVYDESLTGLPEVYFEAGDHDDVVHMSGEAFLELLAESLHGRFSRALNAPDARRSGRSRARSAPRAETVPETGRISHRRSGQDGRARRRAGPPTA